MSVQRMVIDPQTLARLKDEVDTVDVENTPDGGHKGWVQRTGPPMKELKESGVPLNITFSEPSLSHNLEDQINFRYQMGEYCFEKLNCQSLSFVR